MVANNALKNSGILAGPCASLWRLTGGRKLTSAPMNELGGVCRVALLPPYDLVTAAPTPPPTVNCIWSLTVCSKLHAAAPGPIAFQQAGRIRNVHEWSSVGFCLPPSSPPLKGGCVTWHSLSQQDGGLVSSAHTRALAGRFAMS